MVELGLIIETECNHACHKCSSVMMCVRNSNCAYSSERQCHDTRSPTRAPTLLFMGKGDDIKLVGAVGRPTVELRTAGIIAAIPFVGFLVCCLIAYKLYSANCELCR